MARKFSRKSQQCLTTKSPQYIETMYMFVYSNVREELSAL